VKLITSSRRASYRCRLSEKLKAINRASRPSTDVIESIAAFGVAGRRSRRRLLSRFGFLARSRP
jgi:hypothetical protein